MGLISPFAFLCHQCETPSNIVLYLCLNKLSSPSSPSLLHQKFDRSIPIYPQPIFSKFPQHITDSYLLGPSTRSFRCVWHKEKVKRLKIRKVLREVWIKRSYTYPKKNKKVIRCIQLKFCYCRIKNCRIMGHF